MNRVEQTTVSITSMANFNVFKLGHQEPLRGSGEGRKKVFILFLLATDDNRKQDDTETLILQ